MTVDAGRPDEAPDFEAALAELEAIVQRLEHGEMTLEAALDDFERGIGLVRQCTNTLSSMELRVQRLVVTEDGEILTEPFAPEQDAQPTDDEEG